MCLSHPRPLRAARGRRLCVAEQRIHVSTRCMRRSPFECRVLPCPPQRRLFGPRLPAARKGACRGERPRVAAPHVRLDPERFAVVRLVDEHAAHLVAAFRARLASPGAVATTTARRRPPPAHLELAPLPDRRLVHVAAEDQLRAGGGEPLEHVAPARAAACGAPRRAEQLVVEGDDAECPRGSLRAAPGCALELAAPTRPRWCPNGRTEFTPTTCSRRE